VVYAPVLNKTWCGKQGKQAFLLTDGTKKEIHAVPHQPDEPWKVVGIRSHAGDSLKKYLQDLGEHKLISMGSSIKLCLVADGKAHRYPRLGPTSEWDTAAAHAVVHAAGGEVYNQETGLPLLYNQKESLLNPYFMVEAVAGENR